MSRRFRLLLAAVAAVPPLAWAGPAAADTVPAFSCDYRFSAWTGGFVADLTVVNHGPAVNGWAARWTFRSATGNLTAWQARMAQPDPFTVTATNESYNALIDAGRSVRFGWTASAASTEVPSDITVNGVPC
ncbi:cellulose binding domain-containing protein [Dactylosporangium aurantiacum]|uniref:Cellulose binding domain-containing protein n=1 Tax=Dactylosporangium aurantiacum TaxID=35754 RepID=A0A9Q9ILH7_9ACTN|nr:cellulose binding domain-containing protein [Dactylosporangium aurantiacum]MDG6103264.1 cellulose binding domain-containing protein [Dactylosporangium aurantiacum]UWZ57766.1 cellulose binding domain-containing protein [Dactylosporangium aurantiacum]